MARPKVKIDWNEVGEMLVSGCDTTSIATALGVSPDTLYVRSKQDNKVDFSAFSQQKKAEGKELLRRKQFEVAMNGNVSMLIWLGKNRLGQTEKREINDGRDPISIARAVFQELIDHGEDEQEALDFAVKRYGVLADQIVTK